jgi:glutathione peroxidase
MTKSIYDYEVLDINGNKVQLNQYRGKTLLIVNVASKCGFTPQYTDLDLIYKENKDQDFVVLGFPCNQFGAQEPGDENEIKQFCSLNYDVSFPMFSKVDVNGENASPLYEFLKNSLPGILGTKAVKWNFTKFLVNKEGIPVARYAPTDTPRKIEEDIKKIL